MQRTLDSSLARWAAATELHGEISALWATGQFAEHKAVLLDRDLLKCRPQPLAMGSYSGAGSPSRRHDFTATVRTRRPPQQWRAGTAENRERSGGGLMAEHRPVLLG